MKCIEEYYAFHPQMKQIRARESGAVYQKRKKEMDELLKQNEGFLLKYVTRGENQNEIHHEMTMLGIRLLKVKFP